MKTKQFVLPLAVVITVLVIVLAACGAKASTTTTIGGARGAPAANGTPGAANLIQPLPLAESLLIGTFKLQGTGNAVTSTQATALVPLWQAYAQLTNSTSAAQAEVDAVVAQIQTTLTPAQVSAITAMKLTRQDMVTEMSNLGLSSGTPGFSGTPRAGTGGAGGFAFGGGGAGGAGGGVPGAAGGTTARPTQNATQIALRAQFANRIPTTLLNALVALLQKTAGA